MGTYRLLSEMGVQVGQLWRCPQSEPYREFCDPWYYLVLSIETYNTMPYVVALEFKLKGFQGQPQAVAQTLTEPFSSEWELVSDIAERDQVLQGIQEFAKLQSIDHRNAMEYWEHINATASTIFWEVAGAG